MGALDAVAKVIPLLEEVNVRLHLEMGEDSC